MEGMLFLFGLYWGSLERAVDGDHGEQLRHCLVPPPVSAGGKEDLQVERLDVGCWWEPRVHVSAFQMLCAFCFGCSFEIHHQVVLLEGPLCSAFSPLPPFYPSGRLPASTLPVRGLWAKMHPVREPSFGEQRAQARQVRAGPRGARAGPLGKAGHRLHVQTTGTQP